MLGFFLKKFLVGNAEDAENITEQRSWASRSALSACSARNVLRTPKRRPAVEHLEDRLMLNAGDLDVVFAGGKATADFSVGAAQVHALAVQADSRIVAVGQAGGGSSAFALARFNLNGTLDTSFGTGGEVTSGIGPSDNGVANGV